MGGRQVKYAVPVTSKNIARDHNMAAALWLYIVLLDTLSGHMVHKELSLAKQIATAS